MTDSTLAVRNRMETHVTVLAVLYLAFSALGVLAGGLAFLFLAGGSALTGDLAAAGLGAGMGAIIGGGILVLSIPGLLAGWGLLKRKEWARILALVLSFINLINIPFGTIMGAYGIWVLLNEETKALFAEPRPVPAM